MDYTMTVTNRKGESEISRPLKTIDGYERSLIFEWIDLLDLYAEIRDADSRLVSVKQRGQSEWIRTNAK